MLNNIRFYWKSILLTVIVIWLSFIPGSDKKMELPKVLSIAIDKWEHIFAYFVYAFFMIADFKLQTIHSFIQKKAVVISSLSIFILGILIEIGQKLIPSLHRTANPKDALANLAGIILAVIFYYSVRNISLPFFGKLK